MATQRHQIIAFGCLIEDAETGNRFFSDGVNCSCARSGCAHSRIAAGWDRGYGLPELDESQIDRDENGRIVLPKPYEGITSIPKSDERRRK